MITDIELTVYFSCDNVYVYVEISEFCIKYVEVYRGNFIIDERYGVQSDIALNRNALMESAIEKSNI